MEENKQIAIQEIIQQRVVGLAEKIYQINPQLREHPQIQELLKTL